VLPFSSIWYSAVVPGGLLRSWATSNLKDISLLHRYRRPNEGSFDKDIIGLWALMVKEVNASAPMDPWKTEAEETGATRRSSCMLSRNAFTRPSCAERLQLSGGELESGHVPLFPKGRLY
jgi:hypothetical protein